VAIEVKEPMIDGAHDVAVHPKTPARGLSQPRGSGLVAVGL
jgi:hypothetical protein